MGTLASSPRLSKMGPTNRSKIAAVGYQSCVKTISGSRLALSRHIETALATRPVNGSARQGVDRVDDGCPQIGLRSGLNA